MTAEPRPPLLKRLPPGVWVAAAWVTVIAVRSLQRPDELHRLFRYHGNVEDGPLLLTAVVTTLVAVLLFRVPAAAVAVALAGCVFSLGMDVRATPFVLFFLADALVGFTAATRPRRYSVPTALLPVGVVAGHTAWEMWSGYPSSVSVALGLVSGVAVAWLVGHNVRQGREHVEELRLQATRQAVTAERLRIARELHDMVAHAVGVVAIQAGVGHRVMDTQPEQAREALKAIEATGRETLAGLRRMLGALRESDPEPGPQAPAPGLADLGRLVATAGNAGVRVAVEWRGEHRELPAEVELAAFRIVQEAVTNVVRHSGAAECRVTVDHRPDGLAVEVVDAGCGGGAGGAGYGIVGMRERVGLLHGSFSAGPRAGGGFRVAAQLPVPAEAGR
ncbi:sensor histidine kinase [Kitasatospora sp. KL5]|uniref:sensor histidine kinase n=1 Tax=Kitasatospora sp. KL5 TaxID=3425125 RepID=UPI003D6E734B